MPQASHLGQIQVHPGIVAGNAFGPLEGKEHARFSSPNYSPSSHPDDSYSENIGAKVLNDSIPGVGMSQNVPKCPKVSQHGIGKAFKLQVMHVTESFADAHRGRSIDGLVFGGTHWMIKMREK